MALKLTADCSSSSLSSPYFKPVLRNGPYSRSSDGLYILRCATNVLVTVSISWCTTRHTQENIHTCVTSVGSTSHSLVTLRLMLLYMQANAHICVKTVARVSDELHIYRNMLFCTRGRGLRYVLSAQRHLYAQLIWGTILLYTLWTGHMSVRVCTKTFATPAQMRRHRYTHNNSAWCRFIFHSGKMWIIGLILRSIWKCEECPSQFCIEASICTDTFKYLHLGNCSSTPQMCIFTVQVHHLMTNTCIWLTAVYFFVSSPFPCSPQKAESACLLGCDGFIGRAVPGVLNSQHYWPSDTMPLGERFLVFWTAGTTCPVTQCHWASGSWCSERPALLAQWHNAIRLESQQLCCQNLRCWILKCHLCIFINVISFIQAVSFVAAPSTAALSHRQSVCVRTSGDSFSAEHIDKRNTQRIIQVWHHSATACSPAHCPQ